MRVRAQPDGTLFGEPRAVHDRRGGPPMIFVDIDGVFRCGPPFTVYQSPAANNVCMPNGRMERSSMDRAIWYDFITGLRAEQDGLRAELEPYETGKMRVQTRPLGGVWGDTTDATIVQIKDEIASLQRTIGRVIAEQKLYDA
jgi:hypothetical protein